MSPNIETMAAENRWLREQLAGLTGDTDQHTSLRVCLRLSPKQAAVMALLMNTNRPLSADTIWNVVFQHPNGDGPTLESVKVTIANIRRRLEDMEAPMGVSSAYGSGCYAITPILRAWIQTVITMPAAQQVAA